MKKVFLSSISIIICLVMIFSCTAYAAVTAADTPVSASETELKWSVKLGSNYKTAPGVPALYGSYIYTMSGTSLMKLDASTGATVSQAEMEGRSSYGYTPVLCTADKIYCPLGSATVEAFYTDSLSRAWSYSDSAGGQSLTPIVCDSGRIYTGFWNADDTDAAFVCLSASDGSLLWRFTHTGGFYWAECAVTGSYIVIAGDDGTSSDSGANKVYCLNAQTGKVIDSADITGDIRSGIAYSGGYLYFVSKAGYLFRTGLDSDGKFGTVSKVSIGGASTSTPVIYNGRVYIGVQVSGFTSGKVAVYDASSLSLITSADVTGYPQCSMLISTSGSSPVIYTTCNGDDGGITALTFDSSGNLKAEEIYSPESGKTGCCISTVSAGSDGTLYYKNDSGNIFAVGRTDDSSDGNSSSFFDILVSLVQRLLLLIKLLLAIIVT